MDTTPFLPVTYPPSSDLATGTKPNQIVWGRTGNDVILGYHPLSDVLNNQIDIFLGDSELSQLVDPTPRDWRNQFILGDWRTPYYTNGNLFLFGLNNFALLADFDPTRDIIQLYGQPSDYQLLDLGFGTIISYQQKISPNISVPDVVAILPGSGLNLNKSYFQYVGYTPPQIFESEIKQIGTAGLEISDSTTVDSRGNVWVAGTTTGSLFAPNVGLRDVWFSKYDKYGNLLLAEQVGTTVNESVFSIVTDSENNLFMVGSSQGGLGGPLQGIDADAWIAKYDSNGNQQWLQKITGTGEGQPAGSYGIDIDAEGNVYVSGVVNVPTPPDSVFPLSTDNFVAKYDNNGNQQWIVQQGKPGIFDFDEAYNSAVDSKGNLYSIGFTTSDFAGTSAQLYDAWISKYDNSGQREWIRQIATPDYDWAWGVDTDRKDAALVAGWTLGSLAGTAGNLGSYDAWLAKYDKNGNQKWVKQFGTSGDDEAFGVEVGVSNIYVIGYTDSAFEGYNNQGSFDAWVARFDHQGNQKWVTQFGTAGTDQAYDIVLRGNYVYVTGITNGSLGTANHGSFDTWVAKFDKKNGEIQNFSESSDPDEKPEKRGSELLDLVTGHRRQTTLVQDSQSSTNQNDGHSVPLGNEADLRRLVSNTLAQRFNVDPNALPNGRFLENLIGSEPSPYGGVEANSLDPTNPLSDRLSNGLNALLLPGSQPSIADV